MQTTLNLITRGTSGRTRNQSIGNVNPDAKKSSLRNFAESFAALSTRTLDAVYKVDKKNITNATKESAQTAEPVITPAVTIANGALKITSPLLTASKANALPMKILCALINNTVTGNIDDNLGITYTSVDGIVDGFGRNDLCATGTLESGFVVTRNTMYSNSAYHLDINIWDDLANSLLDTDSDKISEGFLNNDIDDLSTAISDGAFLSMANFVTHINSKFATNDCSILLSHNAENASLCFTPTFSDNTAVADKLDFYGGETIWIHLINAIGSDIFADYSTGSDYSFTIPNPAV